MEEKILSASRIKVLEDCSWKYWCKYILHLPDPKNDGAVRGTVCHLVFEVLLNSRHKRHYDSILKEGTIEASPPVARLVEKGLKREGEEFLTKENYELCDKMILVGLNQDFFGEDNGGVVESGELKFLLENEDPKYKILGFIDKPIVYENGKRIKLVDYKTSKSKFKGSEITANLQAMAYSLASKKLWPKLESVITEFLFLKFPKQPVQEIEISKDQMSGFEYYLADLFKMINNFTKEDAKSNYASRQPYPSDKTFGGPLNCGFAKRPGQLKKDGSLMWHCSFKFPFDYFVVIDKDGKQLRSARHEEELTDLGEGEKIEMKHYEGCPAHCGSPEKQDDPFDF